MGRTVIPVSPRDSFIEPGYPAARLLDPLRNFPVGHPNALINYYRTKDVLVNRTEKVPTRTHNDVNFGIQKDISRGQGPVVRSRPWDLTTVDFVNLRDRSDPDATSGLFVTGVDVVGAFIPAGTHSVGDSAINILTYVTATAHLDGIAVVGLFKVDPVDSGGIVGVVARSTSTTDHVRFEVRTSGTQAHLVTRDADSDTSDADIDVADEFEEGTTSAGGETFLSIGLRIDAVDDTYIAVVNGEIVLEGTLSSDAQAHTGHGVGVRTADATSFNTGPLLFQAIDLKV